MNRRRLPKGFVARAVNIRVVDGDSVECDFKGSRERVRLYGIDAPELAQSGGAESAGNLAAMTRRDALMMEVMSYDRYGRLVGLLYPARSNRRNSLNLRMVREGQAYAYLRFGGAELGFGAAERDAQSARQGVWRSSRKGGERPWDYRSSRGAPAKSPSKAWLIILVIALLALAAAGAAYALVWFGL